MNSALTPSEMETLLRAGLRGLCVTDVELRCRYATPLLGELLGCTASELLGRPVQEILRPDGLPMPASLVGQRKPAEAALARFDGTTFPAEITSEEMNCDHCDSGYVFFVRDITEEKHMQDMLRKTEKLASAGRMAAVIAHEINNPLEAVMNLLYLLRHQPLTPQGERFLSLAESEVERVSRIARQTLGFYRETGKPGKVDVRELLNLSVDVNLLRHPDVRVHRRYRTSSPVCGYGAELQQVFHNFIANALEAGAKDIFLHLRKWTESAVPRRTGIRITIADNGSGIDPAVSSKIFNPFITTKGESGTGLGLWTSRGIIARHEGSIQVRTSTTPGNSGTCFQIFLPH